MGNSSISSIRSGSCSTDAPLPFKKCDDLLQCRFRARLWYHIGADPLAQYLVRHTHHGHIWTIRVNAHQVLDLDRTDILTAPDNDVLDAAGDPDVALLILFCLVARPEKAVLGKGLALSPEDLK